MNIRSRSRLFSTILYRNEVAHQKNNCIVLLCIQSNIWVELRLLYKIINKINKSSLYIINEFLMRFQYYPFYSGFFSPLI